MRRLTTWSIIVVVLVIVLGLAAILIPYKGTDWTINRRTGQVSRTFSVIGIPYAIEKMKKRIPLDEKFLTAPDEEIPLASSIDYLPFSPMAHQFTSLKQGMDLQEALTELFLTVQRHLEPQEYDALVIKRVEIWNESPISIKKLNEARRENARILGEERSAR